MFGFRGSCSGGRAIGVEGSLFGACDEDVVLRVRRGKGRGADAAAFLETKSKGDGKEDKEENGKTVRVGGVGVQDGFEGKLKARLWREGFQAGAAVGEPPPRWSDGSRQEGDGM